MIISFMQDETLPESLDLPTKPSELIRVAIKDLIAIEQDRRYVVDMTEWHRPNSHCRVCFAGAVIALRVGLLDREIIPSQFGLKTYCALLALNDFRQGFIHDGVARLDLALPPDATSYWNVVPYGNYPELFKDSMRELATYLETLGM